jgi:hypothetical protein
LVGNPEGGRPLRRPRRRWEYNIGMDLKDAGWKLGFNWLRIEVRRGFFSLS